MNIRQCDLCPRKCGVNREQGKVGFCGAGDKIEISWFGLHFGEEPAISGTKGSGTIFFCHCNLKCVFCQNWQISQIEGYVGDGGFEGFGGCKGYEGDEVVGMMLELQEMGALNINLVTPTIWSYWLKEIILKAKKKGLRIPIVWNSNGYEDLGVLREFAGVVDIYLPDYKYDVEELAIRYSSAPKYPKVAREAILEMYRQVGDFSEEGPEEPEGQEGQERRRIKGLIVRHLVLPGQIENTVNSLRFIRGISQNIHLSLMSQYNPLYKAEKFPEINRRLKKEEYERVLREVRELGFRCGWIQEFGGAVKYLTPDFCKENPFVKQC